MTVLTVDDVAPARAGSRDPEWAPETCRAVIGLCEDAMGRWPEQFPTRFASLVDMSRRLPGAAPAERHEWQRLAADLCRQAATVDPDWFCRYWRQVVRRGVRPPADVTRVLVGLDFLRPPGTRTRAPGS
ncbi:MAG: hypothetical protein KGJ77_07130 [Acidobacteriota bacterium]|nr:hypothetical protein [Acidobacteriota bacterium]